MSKSAILISCVVLLSFGCQRRLYSEYTSAYKENIIYLAGTNINFRTDSTFLRTDWTDHLGYEKIGKGRYIRTGKYIILVYEGFEDQILEHIRNTKEQIQVNIETQNSAQAFAITLKVKDSTGHEIIGYKVSLLNPHGDILKENYLDLEGISTFEITNAEPEYTLKFQHHDSEQLHFEFNTSESLDTMIYLAEHIPFVETGRIDTFEIKSFGTYIQDKTRDFNKLKKNDNK